MELIAEVKTCSPYGYKSDKTWDELFDLANEYGDMISIHTDPRWGGSYEKLKEARSRTSKAILAKGIHPTNEEVCNLMDIGANYVLVVGRVPHIDIINRCLLEPSSIEEIESYPRNAKIVWNARDLDTGKPKDKKIDDVRKVWSGWLCQASLISSMDDVYRGVDAILVGQNLVEYCHNNK